jgi:hypothetical protein
LGNESRFAWWQKELTFLATTKSLQEVGDEGDKSEKEEEEREGGSGRGRWASLYVAKGVPGRLSLRYPLGIKTSPGKISSTRPGTHVGIKSSSQIL